MALFSYYPDTGSAGYDQLSFLAREINDAAGACLVAKAFRIRRVFRDISIRGRQLVDKKLSGGFVRQCQEAHGDCAGGESERGLSGNEIGEIVQLSPRSFMNHFRELEGVLREKHDGVYVYFSKNPSKYAKQSSNRVPVEDAGKIGDATAVKILVEYIRHPAISTEELSDLLRQRKGCRVSASEIENFLAFHGLLKKKRDARR